MDLKEHEGRAIFSKYGIPVPRGFLLRKASHGTPIQTATVLKAFLHSEEDVKEFALKAQPLSGKRGKHGGIVFTDVKNFRKNLADLRKRSVNGEKVKEVLAVEKLDIAKEYYLSITLDRDIRLPIMIFSDRGGVDIEETANNHPSHIKKIPFRDVKVFPEKAVMNLSRRHFKSAAVETFMEIARNLHRLFINEDCLLAEINPLILTKDGSLYAADSKVTMDDSSVYRHPKTRKYLRRNHSGLEAKAAGYGLAYVELQGNLAIIGNGAGLVMSTLDAVKHFGAEPANFCDLGGGASEMMVEKAMEIVLKKRSIKALLINIFGGITRCDEVALGIVRFYRASRRKTGKKMPPMVVRLVGTNEDKGVKILKKNHIKGYTLFSEAAEAAAELTK